MHQRNHETSVRNWALVRLGQADKYLRGDRWRPLIQWFYTIFAPLYDWAAQRLVPDYQRAVATLLSQMDVQSSDRVLDLGCGTGIVTMPARMLADTVVGIDLTHRMLRTLQRHAHMRGMAPLLIRGDVRRLPLADQSCDVIVTSFMLLHLTNEEKQQVFQEAQRVLTPRGRFGCLTGQDWVGNAYPTPEAWRAWFMEQGFVNVRVTDGYTAFRILVAQRGETHIVSR